MHKEFKAFVEQDKFDDTPFLKITHNGYQFQTIRIDDPLQEIPIIISVLQNYFAGYCTGIIEGLKDSIKEDKPINSCPECGLSGEHKMNCRQWKVYK